MHCNKKKKSNRKSSPFPIKTGPRNLDTIKTLLHEVKGDQLAIICIMLLQEKS